MTSISELARMTEALALVEIFEAEFARPQVFLFLLNCDPPAALFFRDHAKRVRPREGVEYDVVAVGQEADEEVGQCRGETRGMNLDSGFLAAQRIPVFGGTVPEEKDPTMSRFYEFVVDETYTIPCRYQVEAESEAEARRKAEVGDVVQNQIDGREQLTGRNIGEVVSVFGDDDN